MPDLCGPDGAATPAAGPGADADAEAFFAAVARGCPLPEGVPVLRLSAGHALLAAPAPGLPRHACRVCGHTFRPQEQVVVCPGSPAAPRCPVAVHRDVLRQLFCWDDWYRLNPDPKGRPCLAMA